MSNPEQSNVPRRGYDDPIIDPTKAAVLPYVRVEGDADWLDTYVSRNGLQRVMPITHDGILIWGAASLRDRTDSDATLATIFRTLVADEKSQQVPAGTVHSFMHTVVREAYERSRQTDT